MKKAIVITDLTRMYRQTVCIAGYDESGNCIRPTLPPPGIAEQSLYNGKKLMTYPFALVEFDILQHLPQPPHTEDHRFLEGSPQFLKRLTPYESEEVLKKTIFSNVETIFEQTVKSGPGHYVLEGQGPRSIGTVRPKAIHKVIYAPSGKDEGGAWDYRLGFYDPADKYYRLKITDLTWHYFCNSLRNSQNDLQQIADQLTRMLKSRTVYLRIGLARGWKEFPDRCYLQITGIHTFPDYLNGKTFADFI